MPAIRRGDSKDLVEVAAIQTASPEAAHWNVADYLQYGFLVCEDENRIAGFLVWRVLTDAEGELLNLAVAPEFRRRGVARALVGGLLKEVSGTVYLEVRESNSAAINFYKSMQFQYVSRRPGYYESPPEAAIVMKFHSC
jgi:ribosomal-protein-alanine N-acetyltransferase